MKMITMMIKQHKRKHWRGVAKLAADDLGSVGIKIVVTDGAPVPAYPDLHPPTGVASPVDSRETDLDCLWKHS